MSQYTDFFEESNHPLAKLYRKRVKQSRDLVVLISDDSNDRGTGKTTLALRLAEGMDRNGGLDTDKVSIDPRPLTEAYTTAPRGSGLVLDEAEVGLSKYQASSAVNRALRDLVSMGRIEQKYTVLNAPASGMVDSDLKSLCDVWILVKRRGFAQVFRMDYNPHGDHELTHSAGTLEWEPIEKDSRLGSVYEYLTEKKEQRLRGDENDDDYVRRGEVEKMVSKARKEAVNETRDDLIASMVEAGLGHEKVGDIVGLSRSRVSQIAADHAD